MSLDLALIRPGMHLPKYGVIHHVIYTPCSPHPAIVVAFTDGSFIKWDPRVRVPRAEVHVTDLDIGDEIDLPGTDRRVMVTAVERSDLAVTLWVNGTTAETFQENVVVTLHSRGYETVVGGAP